jgi:hypothetical protein
MSIIIYGRQGIGKSLQAERLRRFYGMDEVCDDEMDPYPLTPAQQVEFKAGKVLFLTHISPEEKGYSTSDKRRIISFEQAMKAMRNEA